MPENPDENPHESPQESAPHRHPGSLTLHVGREELVVRQRYEAAGIVNDALIALWFLIGSIMFFSPAWTRTGTWCFVLGSVELMIRPAIRLARQLHLQRMHSDTGGLTDSDQDY